MLQKQGNHYLTFEVENTLLERTIQYGDQIKAGDKAAVVPAFDGVIKIVDEGVTALIREPKKILKFNFVVDKTLTGVLNMTTHLGYKRLEKLAAQFDVIQASHYVDHFIAFVESD